MFTFCFENYNYLLLGYYRLLHLFTRKVGLLKQAIIDQLHLRLLGANLESTIKGHIVQFLVSKGLITKCQHAFLKNHSAASNLLGSIRDWSISLNSHSRTDVIYIDFSKALDSIVHSQLLFKLELYGVTGNLLQWIRCFYLIGSSTW